MFSVICSKRTLETYGLGRYIRNLVTLKPCQVLTVTNGKPETLRHEAAMQYLLLLSFQITKKHTASSKTAPMHKSTM